MFLLAVQLIAGADIPWLPSKVMNRGMALKRIELISRPRLSYR